MDILTARGLQSRRWEDRSAELWSSQYPDIVYCHTPKNEPATIDAILTKKNQIVAVVEQKSRDISIEKFRLSFNEEWLITAEKIEKGVNIAKEMCVKFVGFLYLIQSDVLLVKTIWDPKWGYAENLEIRVTETMATINGGKAKRRNAYISMNGCLKIGSQNAR